MRKCLVVKFGLFLGFLSISFPVFSQYSFSNTSSQVFRDGYLWNPSLAGEGEGVRIYGLYMNSWSGFDGSPKLINVAADMNFGQNLNFGINVSSFSTGILNRDAGALSYAYAINFSDKKSFRLGGELSFFRGRIKEKNILSDAGQTDPVVEKFNQNNPHFSGNIGASLRINNFYMGATGYNLDYYMGNKDSKISDLELGMFLTSYRFGLTRKELSLSPVVAYKVFSDSRDIFLTGLQFEYENLFHTSLSWQSNGSVVGGLGYILKDLGEANFYYISGNHYGYNERFEVGLKVNIK